jgi:PhzF family phenazine biosynthesis protein
MLPYWIVDAFTDRLFTGNPAAVVLPEKFPADALMQQIAAENNLSETAFAVPEGDDYRLRWFTPTMEVDLCGHATLATAFVLAQQGRGPDFRFHTRSGLLTATAEGERLRLDFPARASEPAEAPGGLAEALGVTPLAVVQSADLIAVLDDAATVASLKPDIARIKALPGGAVIVTAAGGEGVDITSRMFAPGFGIDEDPVTGALHTQVVPYWAEKLGRTTLACRQASARGGTMMCELHGNRVHMSGTAVLFAAGRLRLPD